MVMTANFLRKLGVSDFGLAQRHGGVVARQKKSSSLHAFEKLVIAGAH
jgi:hypothetical protein